VSTIVVTRLARICAYSTHAPEWVQLVRLVTPGIALTARRLSASWGDPSNATVNEIVQEVFLKLCADDRRILREFEDRGTDSLLKLMRTITVSVGTDYFRRTRAEKRGGRLGAVSLEPSLWEEDVAGWPEHEVDRTATGAVELPALMAQLDGLLRLYPETVSARDRALFWLYYRQGLTAEAIARIPSMKLNVKGVESALLRLTRLLRKTILNGKPKSELSQKASPSLAETKGFSQVIAIDSIKRR
jgi:RNA polymerase sigma-70 factor (ECF subfamily)